MIFLVSAALALDPVEQTIEGGTVDWTSLQIKATARGDASIGAITSRGSNEGDALNQLGRRMLDLAPQVRFSSELRGADILDAEDVVADRVDANISSWQVVEARYLESGPVELDASLPLQPLFRPALVSRAQGKEHPPVPGGPTGLVVDARGLSVVPAIAPRLEDPSGNVLYSAETLSAYAAAQKLPVVFVHDPADSACVRRAGAEPMFVRATAVQGGSDLVIQGDDATRIGAAAVTGDFLLHANVVVVVDK